MKRSALIASVVIIGMVLAIILGFNLTRSEIESLLHKDDITRINVFYQPDFSNFDITDKSEIDAFLDIVLNCDIKKQEEGKESTGYIYSLTLYNKEVEYVRISLSNNITIYPNTYDFIEGDIDGDTLIEYLDETYEMNMDNRLSN